MSYTTINKSSEHFNTKLYTGNGGTLVNTGVGFQPDLVWVKSRTQANSHVWFDSIRTFAGGKEIQSNNTGSEGSSDSAGYGYISAVSSDGFTAQAGTTAGDYTNVSSQNYASWNWKANGAGVANTDGSTNTSVSVNTDAGFSIVTYPGNSTSGATFGHGLGVKPSMIITKARTRASMWNVYHKGLTNYTKGIYLNATDAEFADGAFRDGEPNTTTFTLDNGTHVNGSGETYVAYCFAEKTGYSKFGSYVGNGNADGSFIYTGFKPAWVMVKKTSGTGNWFLFDNKRNTFNVVTTALSPDLSDADNNMGNVLDFLSNGFKFKDSYGGYNDGSFIYMAFAEAPLVGTNNIPTTAK